MLNKSSDNPLISVIVPCYNVEAYLPKCVDSIIHQTYQNLEIWLVDDGSPDRCGLICDEYAAKDSRIKVIHKANGGLSDARNVAIDRARGEWITFVDSDDYVSADYVETLYALCSRYHCMMSVADWCIFKMGEESAPTLKKYAYEKFFGCSEALEDMFNQIHFDVSACSKLYHRSLFAQIRYPQGIYFEDLATTFKLMLLCKDGVAYCNRQIYYYLFRNDSTEGSVFSDKKMDSALEVFRTFKDYEGEFTPEVSRAAKSKLSSFCLHLLLKMPRDYARRNILINYLKDVRWAVITNKKARLKTRLGCLSSYLGMRFTQLLFTLVDRRK